MPKRKDDDGTALDSYIRVRLPAELKRRALAKAAGMEYPSDLSAVVRVLLGRWVRGRAGGRRSRRSGG